MPEIKKGNNSANNVSGVTSFNLCRMAGHALHCIKFREIISNGIKVIERTRFLYGKLQRGIIPQKCRWNKWNKSLHVVWSCFIFVPSFMK